jgi:hypothetical protein
MSKQLRSFMTLIFSIVSIGILSAAAVKLEQGTTNQGDIARYNAYPQKKTVATTIADAQGKQSGKKLSFFNKIKVKLIEKYAKKLENAEAGTGKTRSLLALLLGLGSLVTFWVAYLLGALMAVAAVVLGIMALKKEKSKVMAVLGIVFGSLTLLVALLIIVLGSLSFS